MPSMFVAPNLHGPTLNTRTSSIGQASGRGITANCLGGDQFQTHQAGREGSPAAILLLPCSPWDPSAQERSPFQRLATGEGASCRCSFPKGGPSRPRAQFGCFWPVYSAGPAMVGPKCADPHMAIYVCKTVFHGCKGQPSPISDQLALGCKEKTGTCRLDLIYVVLVSLFHCPAYHYKKKKR